LLECPPAKRGGGGSGGARPVYIRRITLERDIEDPRLVLKEAFSTRMASVLAEGLGVGVRGLAEVVEEATKGLGGAIQGLFGGAKKK